MADELARLQEWFTAQCEGCDEVAGNEIPWQHKNRFNDIGDPTKLVVILDRFFQLKPRG